MCQNIPAYSCIFAHCVFKNKCCVLAYLRNAIVSREPVDACSNSNWIRNRINQTFVSGCSTPPCTSNSIVSVHVTVPIHFQLSREPVTHTVWNYRCIQTSCWRRVQVDLIVVLHIRFDTLYLYEFKLIWLWCYTSDSTHSVFTQNTGMCRCAKMCLTRLAQTIQLWL